MQEKLISGDNHIDLTYCPPDLWSSAAPQNGSTGAARRGDGGRPALVCRRTGPGHVERRRPRLSEIYRAGFSHIDEMKDLGFEWGNTPRRRSRGRPRRNCVSPISTATVFRPKSSMAA